jgi:hypothetical protein
VRVTSVEVSRTHALLVVISNPGQVDFCFVLCSRCVVLDYIKDYCIRVVYFLSNFFCATLYNPVLIGATVAPTPQVRVSAMLILPVAGN